MGTALPDLERPGLVLRGRYRLLAEIGAGRTARVWRAEDMIAARVGLAPRHVALKLVPAAGGDLAMLLHREGRRLRALAHPGIVRVFDVDVDGAWHFMVMEEIAGPNLSEVMARAPDGRLEGAQLNRVLRDVAAALDHIHARGIVHGDIKPSNIMVGRGRPAALVDFNIATRVLSTPEPGDTEDTASLVGRHEALTPLYASPQRLAGAETTTQDDVYSLAVVAFRVLAGAAPFGTDNPLQATITGRHPDFPGSMGRRMRQVFLRALAVQDEGRYGTAGELVAALLDERRLPAWPRRDQRGRA